jgi:glutamyl-Q tRNA(Asp) synthetase
VLTRFAPAPTGWLHLGHVVNALYVWGLGHAIGARVLLRIEDHDAGRARPEYERGVLDDLDWLGFAPDMYGTDAFRLGRCDGRQSDRQALYAEAARDLIGRGLIYACTCTRRTPPAADAGAGCPGTCATRVLPLGAGVTWRVRTTTPGPPFDDLLCGAQPGEATGHDVPIRDRDGHWTYQFAVTVDDVEQQVTHVIRGRDLLTSTPTQIRLGHLLGRLEPATFAHHPLVMSSATRKLSKSDGATGVRDLRAAGWSPSRVIGEAASRVGLVPPGSQLDAADVVTLFRCGG